MKKMNNYSILIIDDEPNNIIALTEILETEYTVCAVVDSRRAVETVESDMPDVILLDILMPDKDGYEIIAALKSSGKTRDIPVIFITGLDGISDEKKGLALGAVDYISKPFHNDIVKIRVQNQIKLIERHRQQALVTKITHNFLSDTFTDLLQADTLRMVGEFMDIAQLLLYKMDDDIFICKNEWINPTLNLKTRIGDKLELDEPMRSIINNSLINREGELCLHSNNPTYKEAMKPYRKNFHSYITAPVFIKGKMCAAIDFSREDDGRKWDDNEINLAMLVADVFSGVFERDAIEHDLNTVLKLKNELVAAKEYAEHSSRAKSEFLSRMSHEMLSPMNIIMGMLQVAKLKPEMAIDSLQEIDVASGRLLQVINDVLDISGIEYGIFKLNDSVFNFSNMIDEVLQTAEHNASVKQQSFDRSIDPLIPASLTGDEKRLKMVIANLLANAVKYTPANGEISFAVRVLNRENGTITLQIEVSDNGIGISDEQQKKLFNIFEQGDGGDTRLHGGIGIGLALSKRIVEMMGGNIRVASESGKGSKFTFDCKLNEGSGAE